MPQKKGTMVSTPKIRRNVLELRQIAAELGKTAPAIARQSTNPAKPKVRFQPAVDEYFGDIPATEKASAPTITRITPPTILAANEW